MWRFGFRIRRETPFEKRLIKPLLSLRQGWIWLHFRAVFERIQVIFLLEQRWKKILECADFNDIVAVPSVEELGTEFAGNPAVDEAGNQVAGVRPDDDLIVIMHSDVLPIVEHVLEMDAEHHDRSEDRQNLSHRPTILADIEDLQLGVDGVFPGVSVILHGFPNVDETTRLCDVAGSEPSGKLGAQMVHGMPEPIGRDLLVFIALYISQPYPQLREMAKPPMDHLCGNAAQKGMVQDDAELAVFPFVNVEIGR